MIRVNCNIVNCDLCNKIYKLKRILMLEVDLKSASNFKDFFYKIRFLYNSLSKSGNTI